MDYRHRANLFTLFNVHSIHPFKSADVEKIFRDDLIKVFEDIAQEARLSALEEAANQAEVFKHVGPFTQDTEQDRTAIYNNRTCDYIAKAIRSLKFKPRLGEK